MRTSEQTTTLIAALVAARGAFTPIQKDAIAQTGKDGSRAYRYADLAAILEAIIPALVANQLVILQSIDAESSSLITRVVHTSGEWVESVYPLELHQSPQGLGAALTYGRRYSIQGLLCLASADDDGAQATKPTRPKPATAEAPRAKPLPPNVRPITERQLKRMFVIGSAAGWTRDQITEYLHRHGIEQATAIRMDQYDQICDVFGTPYEPIGDHA